MRGERGKLKDLRSKGPLNAKVSTSTNELRISYTTKGETRIRHWKRLCKSTHSQPLALSIHLLRHLSGGQATSKGPVWSRKVLPNVISKHLNSFRKLRIQCSECFQLTFRPESKEEMESGKLANRTVYRLSESFQICSYCGFEPNPLHAFISILNQDSSCATMPVGCWLPPPDGDEDEPELDHLVENSITDWILKLHDLEKEFPGVTQKPMFDRCENLCWSCHTKEEWDQLLPRLEQFVLTLKR